MRTYSPEEDLLCNDLAMRTSRQDEWRVPKPELSSDTNQRMCIVKVSGTLTTISALGMKGGAE